MKNVFYINCCSDPWFRVAEKLKQDYGYNPAYWIGTPTEDPAIQNIQSYFPDVVFQNSIDAWKGRFPKEIEDKVPYYYLDVDFLRKHAHYELQAIKMMDRMDQDLRSFNFMERQRHFRNMLKQWMAAIDIIKPDIVIIEDIPHNIYDYSLFWLCQEYNIPFLTLIHTSFDGRFFFTTKGFFSIQDSFIDDWHKYELGDCSVESLPEEIKKSLKTLKQEYAVAVPDYMIKQKQQQLKANSTWFQIKRLVRKFCTVYRPYLLGQPAPPTVISHCSYSKNAKKKYEESEGNIYRHELTIRYANKYREKLKKAYDNLVSVPDYNEQYVIFFLHYQPEQTTCPSGDIFVDQRLCIELLLKYLPKNYKVYVKEHPSQFNRYMIGHSGRMRDLYDDLVTNSRVKLIPIEEDTFKLISYSKAVCTVTGTVGWEAIVRQKPVVVFGICWYENYSKGVLRITNEDSAKNLYQFIENYKYNEHSLVAYLTSVGKHTNRAYYTLYMSKEKARVTEKECVQNIISSIIEQIEI